MKPTLVKCATGLGPYKAKGREFERTLELRISPDQHANVRLRVDNIESRIIHEFSPIVLDLLELASYLYVADTSIPRGCHDPFGDAWYRTIHIVIPVREASCWKRVQKPLEELLTFLSGDAQITLDFQPYTGKPPSGQTYIDFPETDAGYKGANTVVLFSGGIDSLAGASQEISVGMVPLLVSHRSAAMRVATQSSLVRQLQAGDPTKVYALNMWVNRMGRGQADVNQRLRSFLYLSLAFAIAQQLRVENILYCENGISSFNLPLAADRIGSRSTRTTNPRVLCTFEALMNQVLQTQISLHNPFLFLSKADVMARIVAVGNGNLIGSAVTCARTIRAKRGTPNCGTCYQCIMRRFASEQRNLQHYDPVRVYAKDIFTDELTEGEERSNPVQWVRFHEKVVDLVDDQFEVEFPETVDFYDFLPGDKPESLRSIFALYRRNAQEVLAVLQEKQANYFRQFLSGELPPHCLLSLIGQRRHLEEPIQPYAVRIAGIAEVALRRAFAATPPESETALQDQLEVIFEAAGDKLHREYPTLVFSIVKTKPDFSTTCGKLFIETKLLKDSRRRAALLDAMLADKEKYSAAGAAVLFLVYQSAAYIADPTELTDKITGEHVFCKVIG
ncbi:MAG TPA: hypothetical protein VJ085_02520 [Candidatus Acidoferrales bacterium]|nr:hypothetical protein [Candidatus Acidoferrales bacterium]